MNWSRGLVFAAVFAVPLPTLSAASAGTMSAFGRTTPVAMSDDDKSGSNTSEADKRAKAVDCSKQADEKKLHGAARKKFRESCKSGK